MPPSFESILSKARSLDDPAERGAYLEEACVGDVELRARVESALSELDLAAMMFADDELATVAMEGAEEGPPEYVDDGLETIGRYQLVDRIGEGGMGEVFLARQTEPVRREVALKLLKPGIESKQVVARFEAERQALALLDHSHIAHVYDGGVTETGRPYFVMEYVAGLPITDFCDERRLTTEERLRLFSQVCEAVHHAHQRGIIHRDLKPSNILVSVSEDAPDTPIPKIIDFGLAKATEQRLTERTMYTEVGMILGTPAYMSPEQAGLNPLAVDTRSDIYALGVLLFELLTGKPPFEAQRLREAGWEEACRIIKEEEAPRPSSRIGTISPEETQTIAEGRQTEASRLRRSLKGDLDWITLKALSKEPDRRYESVREFGQDIEHYLADEPVIARPPSGIYKVRKFAKKHQVAVGFMAVIVILIVASSVVSSVLMLQARLAETEANDNWRVAEEAKRETSETFSQSDFRVAGQLIGQNRVSDAVAHLCRAVRTDPENNQAAYKLFSTLLYHSIPQQLLPAMEHEDLIHQIGYHPDGRRAISSSEDGTVILWDLSLETGGRALARLEHKDPVLCFDLSADGTLLASGTAGGELVVWDLDKDERTSWSPAQRLHEDVINSVCISPDGRIVLTASSDSTVSVWGNSGEELKRIGFSSPVRIAAISRDGRMAAIGGNGVQFDRKSVGYGDRALLRGGWCRVIDLNGWKQINLPSHETDVRALAFSPDGRFLATGDDRRVRLWDLSELQQGRISEQGTSMRYGSSALAGLVFSPDGTRLIATWSEGEAARIWKIDEGFEGVHPLDHGESVLNAGFSVDASTVATVGADGTARLWEARRGEPVSAAIPHPAPVSAVTFSPDGRRLLTAASDNKLYLWDIRPRTVAHRRLDHDHEEVLEMLLSPDDGRLTTWTLEKTLRVWDLATGEVIGEPLYHDFKSPRAWTDTAPQVEKIMIGMPNEVVVWDVGQTPPVSIQLCRDSNVSSVGLSQDGKHAVTGHADGVLRVWDLDWKGLSGMELPSVGKLASGVTACDILEGGSVVAAGAESGEGVLITLDTSRKAVVTSRSLHHQAAISSLRFDQSGTLLATASNDGLATVWRVETGEKMAGPVTHDSGAGSEGLRVSFSPDSTKLITSGSRDLTIRVWSLATGAPQFRPLKHSKIVGGHAVSGDGRLLVTGDDNMAAHVWDLKTGQRLLPPLRHRTGLSGWVPRGKRRNPVVPWLDLEESIMSMVLNHDGSLLATASRDNKVRVWTLPGAGTSRPPSEATIEIAEGYAGRRLDDEGGLATVPFGVRTQVKESVWDQGSGGLPRLAAWLFEDPDTRASAPGSPISMKGLLDRRAMQTDLESKEDVLSFRPGDALSMAMIGSHHIDDDLDNRLSPRFTLADHVQVLISERLPPRALRDWAYVDFMTGTALESDPSQPTTHWSRARYLAGKDDFEAARLALLRALELDRGSARAWKLLGEVYNKLGNMLYATICNREATHRSLGRESFEIQIETIGGQGSGFQLLALQNADLRRFAGGYVQLPDAGETLTRGGQRFLEFQLLLERYPAAALTDAQESLADELCHPFSWVRLSDACRKMAQVHENGGRYVEAARYYRKAVFFLYLHHGSYDWREIVANEFRNAQVQAGTAPETRPIVGRGSTWAYYQSDLNDHSWTQPEYDDSSWKRGRAQLGYGQDDELTELERVPGQITTYFRHEFDLKASPQFGNIKASILADNGAVIYLNGEELFRVAMKPGEVRADTPSIAEDDPERSRAFVYRAFPPSAKVPLREGRNLLAIEVHQDTPASTDLSFDFELSGGAVSAIAEGQSANPAEIFRGLKVPEPVLAEAKARQLLVSGQHAQAFHVVEEALSRSPDSPWLLFTRAELLSGQGALDDALSSVSRAIELISGKKGPLERHYREVRMDLLKRLGRTAAAQADRLTIHAVPERPEDASENHLDLSPYYNNGFDESWTWLPRGGLNGFRNLRPGIRELNGVSYDLRGIVRLQAFQGPGAGADLHTNLLPARIALPVNRQFRRIHFLQTTARPDAPVHGTEIARMVIRYSQGEPAEQSVVYGDNTFQWLVHSTEVRHWPDDRPPITWNEEFLDPQMFGWKAALYTLTWENPHPDREIESITFESAMAGVSPILVAVTVEP